jgi:hypothetical protein
MAQKERLVSKNKNMKIISCILISVITLKTYSQTPGIQTSDKIVLNYSSWFEQQWNDEKSKNSDKQNLCQRGLTLLKFKINGEGKAEGISFSYDVPMYLRNWLIQVLNKVEVKWVNIDKNELIILPVLYLFMGCTTEKQGDDHLGENVRRMLDFGEGKDSLPETRKNMVPVKGIVLPPIFLQPNRY